MVNQIVWQEGMFLSPHHFQYADIQIRHYVNKVAELDVTGGDYGISEMHLNEDLLKIGKLSISRLAGVFPDRSFFESNEEIVLDIKKDSVNQIIYLVAPLALKGGTTFGSKTENRRMVTVMRQILDMHDPTNEPAETETASLSLSLMSEEDITSAYTAIPLFHVLELSKEGHVIVNKDFVPRTICYGQASLLVSRLQEVLALLRARARNIAQRIVAETSVRMESSLSFERMELLIVNRWLLALQNIKACPTLNPKILFDALSGLSVELDAMNNMITDEALSYSFDNQTAVFGHVFSKLREQLTLEKESSIISFDWDSTLFASHRVLQLTLPQDTMLKHKRFVLEIVSKSDTRKVGSIGASACKLAGQSEMKNLLIHGLPGIELSPMSNAPFELRDRSDSSFFEINTQNPMWQSVAQKNETLFLHVDHRLAEVSARSYVL